jgi:TRAP-type C4-dicarboxylate transport system substrate-binding protein
MLKLPVLCDRFFSNPSSRVATDQHWEEKTMKSITRRMLLACAVSIGAAGFAPAAFAEDKITLRMSTPASETDQRSVALAEVFAPGRGGLRHLSAALQRLAHRAGQRARSHRLGRSGNVDRLRSGTGDVLPEFSIFATGYVHQNAAHQVAVFNDPLMDPFKQKVEDELGVKLLAVMYLGRRHVNLRQSKDELTVMTPEDLAGVNLRMPGSDAWQFLGKALGANPTPMAFTEVYTALSTGSVDGQDNPLPTVVDAKFYEVTNQIALTSHLVDLNYVAFSKAVWDKLTPEQQATVQKAAVDAAESGRQAQLKKEEELVSFLREKGLDIYEPDLNAFRTHVQAQYVGSNSRRAGPKVCSTRSTRSATDPGQIPAPRRT